MSTTTAVQHADYPHTPGTLWDCPACEDELNAELWPECPWCGALIDHCQGHGELNGVEPHWTVALDFDSHAARIASHYQTPCGQGAVFASIASTYPRALSDVLDAIGREHREWVTDHPDAIDAREELDTLRSLVIANAAEHGF